MKYIEHLIEPNRLLLSWQAQESKNRSRYVIGELVRDGEKVVLRYFEDTADYSNAVEHGFTGHPAFQIKKSSTFDSQVVEAFVRRLPPRNRSDFYRYLEIRGINPDSEFSDFALLGYTGAKLPDDGFELVHPFENISEPFELITEVAGFRHESEIEKDSVNIGSTVDFVPEPDNSHDKRAVRIELDGKKLGYVDRGRVELFQYHLKADHLVRGEVVRKNGTESRPLIYIYVTIVPKAA